MLQCPRLAWRTIAMAEIAGLTQPQAEAYGWDGVFQVFQWTAVVAGVVLLPFIRVRPVVRGLVNVPVAVAAESNKR